MIGHEISHGFDPEGSQYNAVGDMQEIFTEETLEAYNAKMGCFKTQYSGFVINKKFNIHVSGNQTITEDVADNSLCYFFFLSFF